MARAGLGALALLWAGVLIGVVVIAVPAQFGVPDLDRATGIAITGTSTERTMVASSSTAAARPKPICWKLTRRPAAKPAKTATMMAAAPVIKAAVDRNP